MRIKWRGLELPGKISSDPKFKGDTYAKFYVEPFERGFGTTIGNSLRRILLSSLEGASVTAVEIKGVQHEFSTIPGVMEDVTDIILNIKSLIVLIDGDCPPEGKKVKVAFQGPGEIIASDITTDPSVTIINKDQLIATLTDKVSFEMTLTVKKGRGYVPAGEQINSGEDQVIGVLPIDANYSPVQRVRYAVEETRVGQKTNYDKLVLEIWTNGTIKPDMALVEAAKILRKHVNVFLQNFEVGTEVVGPSASVVPGIDEELYRKLNMSIGELELSVRASNCLESARISRVADLVSRSDADLLKVRSFGRTSLREVKRKLQDLGIDLGMSLPAGFAVTN